MNGTATRAPSRTSTEVARGLRALVTLVALVAGVPAALWMIDGSPVPEHWPGAADLWSILASPDDGTFFLDMLIFAGWVGWATFAMSVLVEVPAAMRGVVAPSLPGLGAQQRLVASLVTAITAMVPASQLAAATAPAPPVGNELLDEFAAPDRPAGGNVPAPPGRPQPSPEPSTPTAHVVVAGETLWEIAAQELGDPSFRHEIFDASTTTVQPDGRRLTDPDAIVPGWTLTIPAAGHLETANEKGMPDTGGELLETGVASQEPRTTGLAAGAASSGAGAASPGAGAVSPDTDAAHADTGAPTLDLGAAHPESSVNGHDGELRAGLRSDCQPTGEGISPGGAPPGGDPAPDDDVRSEAFTRTAGVGAVLAAGLVSLVAVQRALWQRRRRPGDRFLAPSAADQALETRLRHVAADDDVAFIDRTLRTLAMRLDEQRRPLPSLRAARWTGAALELYLAMPAQPVAPFVAGGNDLRWIATLGSRELLDAAAGRRRAPYPSLVSVGHDEEGSLLLVNLEHLGVLSITGPAEVTEPMVTAIAADLATSSWSEGVMLSIVGGLSRRSIEALETGRVRQVTDVEQFFDELTTRASAARRSPEVLLVAEPLAAEQQQRLETVVRQTAAGGQAPRQPVAVVVVGTQVSSGWSLRASGSLADPAAVLEPPGLTIRPQLLDVNTTQGVANLIRNASRGPYDKAAAGRPRPVSTVDGAGEVAASRPVATGDGPSEAATPRQPPHHGSELTAAPARAALPRLIMLGPVEVANAPELAEPNKLGQLTELAVFIALNPGCDVAAVDEAIWPGAIVTKTTRKTAVSKLRRWLGANADGLPLLPRTEGRYTFDSAVRSDWQDWCELLPEGPERAPTEALQEALSLVRGRPLSGRGRRKYAWADHHVQEMIMAIVDAAHELGTRFLAAGQPREALRPILLGLSVEPAVELLWRDRLKAEASLGDREVLRSSVAKLRGLAEDLGGGLDDETEELIEHLIPGR